MRTFAPAAIAVLSLLAVSLVAAPRGDKPAPIHLISCSEPRVQEEYDRGLRALYLGQTEDAIRLLTSAAKRDSTCAMADWALSRALQKAGKHPEALKASAEATELAENADVREQGLIEAWSRLLKAQDEPAAQRSKTEKNVQRDLDMDIAIYPEEPEFWSLRGEAAETPLRAAPFYLALLKLRPDHPFGVTYRPVVPPAPTVKPLKTQPVEKIAEAPKLFDGLGNLSYKVTTSSPDAQKYFEQGLRLFHAYVMPDNRPNSAARCFQYAANLDPDCAMAYWGLSFCPTDAMEKVDAANRAAELALKNGTAEERWITAARLLEVSGSSFRNAFLDALDGAIVAYPDDVELWIWRGKVDGGNVPITETGNGYGFSTATLSGIPFQLVAHRMHPEHPAPNHELIHAYEGIDRPALGWPYTVAFRESAPNLPHAQHMQAHLAMRLGRWQEAIDCTRASRKKALEGYPELDPGHHIDVLIRALAHEGRFQEAEAETKAYRDGLAWARLLQLKAEPLELSAWAERRAITPEGKYVAAIAKLDAGDLTGAQPFVAAVDDQFKRNRNGTFYHYQEIHGRLLVQSGKAEEGLEMLRVAAKRAVLDYGLHAWGGGSYMLEVWGEAALRAHRWDEAEKAFAEALAHEHGSVIGALGMQVVWENRNRPEMVAHYARRAAEIWERADAGALERQLERLRHEAAGSVASSPKPSKNNPRAGTG